jgi:hypothetical protein
MIHPMRRVLPPLGLLLALLVVTSGVPAVLAGASPRRTAAVWPKRGVASARYLAYAPAVLSPLRAAWAYDWSARTPPRSPGLDWVPMVWGAGSLTRATMASLRTARSSGRASNLLGFNEPDYRSQSNLTPQHAARLWPQLQRTGLRLGSPAPAVPTDGWLARFMQLARARHLRVDFLALHYYQDFTDPHAVTRLRRALTAIHNRYRKPIWITEIGAMDIRRWHRPMVRTPTAALAAGYMRRLFSMLDGLPFIERYAWFTDDCWNDAACRFASLITPRRRLSRVGRTFATAP